MSNDGIKESSLNLAIAIKLRDLLEDEGIETVMTREDENNIADSDKQDSIRQMKVSDINNRVKIANSSGADLMISIHMNKFSSASSRGWQSFYSPVSEKGKKLAENIQEMIGESILDESEGKVTNKRVALKIENIKIVDKSLIPTVIVECGFLSNPDELLLLQNEDYQRAIARGIVNGVKKYCQ